MPEVRKKCVQMFQVEMFQIIYVDILFLQQVVQLISALSVSEYSVKGQQEEAT